MSDMDDKIRMGDLLGFYGSLLTDHQRQIYTYYAADDLSLSEIAENTGTSRQAVHDLIRRCTREMEEYETCLHLISRFRIAREKILAIRAEAMALPGKNGSKIIDLADSLMEEL